MNKNKKKLWQNSSVLTILDRRTHPLKNLNKKYSSLMSVHWMWPLTTVKPNCPNTNFSECFPKDFFQSAGPLDTTRYCSSCCDQASIVEVCTGMGTSGIPRNPRVSHWCGYECCGNTAGMNPALAGFQRDGFYYGGNPALNHYVI